MPTAPQEWRRLMYTTTGPSERQSLIRYHHTRGTCWRPKKEKWGIPWGLAMIQLGVVCVCDVCDVCMCVCVCMCVRVRACACVRVRALWRMRLPESPRGLLPVAKRRILEAPAAAKYSISGGSRHTQTVLCCPKKMSPMTQWSSNHFPGQSHAATSNLAHSSASADCSSAVSTLQVCVQSKTCPSHKCPSEESLSKVAMQSRSAASTTSRTHQPMPEWVEDD
eukprot:1593097-Amphidinium_carterae.1